MKGFAFVTMETEQEAQNAISSFNEKMLDDRAIRVSVAKPRTDSPRSSSYSRDR
jgi:RNA recognition motif-containing protein